MVSDLPVKSSYLALDPGETTGWATFNAEGKVLAMGQFKQKDQTKELTDLIHSDLKCVIVEDYRNYSFKSGQNQQRWSRNQTSKNIGAIEMLAELRGVPVVLQGANVKTVGYKWSGIGAAPLGS